MIFWRVILALLGLLLIANAALAFSDYTVESITSQAAVKAGSTQSFDSLVNQSRPYIQQFDESVAAHFDFNCTLGFQNSVDTIVRGDLYIINYQCPSSGNSVTFSRAFSSYIVNGTALLLSNQTPSPVITYAQFIGGSSGVNSSNSTSNLSSSPTPFPTIFPQYNVSSDDLEVLRQFLISQSNAARDAQVEAEVLTRLNDYGCFLTSERKSDYYNKWNSLTDVARNCYPYFLASNRTNAQLFSRTCSYFGYAQDQVGAFYGASYTLDEYVRGGLGDMKVEQFKQIILLDSGDTSTSIQNVPYYYPKQISVGCVGEFEKTKAVNEAGTQSGFSRSTIFLSVILLIAFYFLLYYADQ